MNTKAGPKTTKTTLRQPAQWKTLVVFTTRILPATRTRLEAAANKNSDYYTGMGPQDIAEAALNKYFDQLGIPAADQLDQGES